jgi:hypothetical protein
MLSPFYYYYAVYAYLLYMYTESVDYKGSDMLQHLLL